MKEYLSNVLIGFSSPGPDARETNGLEALLGMCRVFGWMYEITKEESGKYTVELKALAVPTDFYWPCLKDSHIVVVGCNNPQDGLTSAMSHLYGNIVSNGRQFRNSFMWYWETMTMRTWEKYPEVIAEKSLCIGEMK